MRSTINSIISSIFLLFLSINIFAQKEESKKIDSLESTLIKEVKIIGKKKIFEQKVDRLVFNVENSIMATGGDATDALKIIPRLKLENNQLTMLGKNNMLVMVDDRLIQLSGEALVDYLKSIPNETIKSIEVISSPPAKYSAEGDSGLINIILKKAKNNQWKTTLRSSFTQATYAFGNIGANFSYQKNKWSFLADLSLGTRKNIYTNNINYLYPSSEFWKTDLYNRNNTKSISPIFTIIYSLDKKNTLGLQYNGYMNKQDIIGKNKLFIYQNDSMQDLTEFSNTNSSTDTNISNHSFNFNLNHKIDTLGKKYTIDIDYFNNYIDKKNPFTTTDYYYAPVKQEDFFTLNTGVTKIQNIASKIDFYMPKKWATYEYGAKASYIKTDNSVAGDFYQMNNGNGTPYLSQYNSLIYKEYNEAAYFSVDKRINEKWNIKIGLRTESTQYQTKTHLISQGVISDSISKQNYTKLFPTFYLSYVPNQGNNFSITINRRIQRPAFWQLNPARWYSNLNSYSMGNPFLQPNFSYNLEINHTFKDKLTSNFWFSKIKNGFGQLTTYNQENVIFVQENYFDSFTTGLSENYNANLFKWWYTSSGFWFNYSETKTFSEYLAPTFSGWGGGSYSNNTFHLNKKKTFSMQVDYYYNFPTISNESRLGANSSLNIGFRYKLLNDKLQMNILFNNILRSDRQTISNITQGVNQLQKPYNDTQYLRFGLSYSFGNKNIYINKLEGGNQEEKQRSN